MPSLRLVSINILNDISRWEQRRDLLLEGLRALDADVITLQEVSLVEQNAVWLASQLGFDHMYISPRTAPKDTREAIALLSRIAIHENETLDLQNQSRVAQRISLQVDNKRVDIVNTHLFFWPGETDERLAQVQLIYEWLGKSIEEQAVVVCGDFNAVPQSATIQHMKSAFRSAHEQYHRREPDFTAPTPLVRMSMSESIRSYLRDLKTNRSLKPWRGTLDYIFINELVGVKRCEVVLNQPARGNRHLYPSDHFGLMADLEF